MGMSDLNERLNQLEQGALNFLFPRRCPFCNQHIGNKELICAGCEKKLPYTGDRAVRQTSWGRVAAPLYYEDSVRGPFWTSSSRAAWAACPASAA